MQPIKNQNRIPDIGSGANKNDQVDKLANLLPNMHYFGLKRCFGVPKI